VGSGLIWDAQTAAFGVAGSYGLAVEDILVDTGATLPGLLVAIEAFLNPEIADILTDTGATLPATLAAIEAFLNPEIADILTDTGVTLPATLAAIIADIGVFPSANYATLAAYVEDIRIRLIDILADVTGLAGAAMRGTDNIKAYSEFEYEGDLAAGVTYTPGARIKFIVIASMEGLDQVNLEADIDVAGWTPIALGSATASENWRGPFYQTSSQLLRVINDSAGTRKLMLLGEVRAA